MERQLYLNKNFTKIASVSEYLDQPLARAEAMSRLTIPILETIPEDIRDEYISMFSRVSIEDFSEDEPIIPTALLSDLFGLNQFDDFHNLGRKLEEIGKVSFTELYEIAVFGTEYSSKEMEQYLKKVLVSNDFRTMFKEYMNKR